MSTSSTVAHDLQEGLVVHDDGELFVAEGEVADFVEGPGQGLPLHWGVPRLCARGELAAGQQRGPAGLASYWHLGVELAVLLGQVEVYPCPAPVCLEGGGYPRGEGLDATLHDLRDLSSPVLKA